MELQKSFGDTVKSLREQQKLTLREVATALEIDISMLGKIEKNNRKPTKQLIEKLAAFFTVTEKELMIAFVSDTVAYQVMEEEDFSNEVFKAAEEKVRYLKTKQKPGK